MTRSKPVYDAGVIVAMLVATGAVLGAALFETAGYGALATATGAVYARPRSAPSGVGTTEPTGLPPSRPTVTVSPALLRLSDNNGAWTGADAVARFRHQQSTGQVDAAKVNDLRVLCAYDTKLHTRMNPNLIIVNGALIGTTEHGTFSIDPANCHENWRVTENYKSSSLLAVSRGTARHDSLLFRGTEDNRLLAYNLRTGKRVWEAKTAEARVGESAPAGPIAWDGLIFSGNAGPGDDGEDEGMYALDAKTGKIVWEFYLLPPVDDESPVSLRGATRVARPTPEQSWDRPVTRGATWTVDRLALRTGMVAAPRASAAPAVATDPGALRLQLEQGTGSGHEDGASVNSPPRRSVETVASKDLHRSGADTVTPKTPSRLPANRIENVDAPSATAKSVHFCPGTVSRREPTGSVRRRQTNPIAIGELGGCVTAGTETPGAAGSGVETTERRT